MTDPDTHLHQESDIPQPWHLVRPSVWPVLGAVAAGLVAVSLVLYMHKDPITIGTYSFYPGFTGVLLGIIAVLMVLFFWWRDIIIEAFVEKAHSRQVKDGLHYGMALFISSEVMFFVAFFWAYYSAALFPSVIFDGIWPPANIHPPAPFGLPFVMTLILLTSGVTVTWAHHAIQHNQQRNMVRALAVTVVLGLCFTLCQIHEYVHADFSLSSGMFGSTFYMATGFHGLHVIIGSIFLAVCLSRARQNQFTSETHFGLTAAAWYWHFVDVVWLFLFVSIYWYGGS